MLTIPVQMSHAGAGIDASRYDDLGVFHSLPTLKSQVEEAFGRIANRWLEGQGSDVEAGAIRIAFHMWVQLPQQLLS